MGAPLAREPLGRSAGAPTAGRSWLPHFDHFLIVAPILVLTSLAVSLRFYCLGCHGLWLDEISTSSVLMQPTLIDAYHYAGGYVDHTPLHFLLTWFAAPLGRDEFAVRIPYAIAGVAASLATYRLGLQLGGRTVGWAAGLLVAVLPFAVYYSQESRPTILVILLAVALMSVAYSAAHRGTIREWGLLAFLGVVGIYTSYLALMAVGVAYGYCGLLRLLGFLADARNRRSLRPSVVQLCLCFVSGVAVVAAFVPWLHHFQAFLSSPDVGFGRADSSAPLTADAVSTLLASLDLHGLLFWLAVIGIATAVIDLVWKRSDRALLLLMWFFLPLAFFAVRTGPGIVTIWPRYFVIDYPAAILLAAMGVWGTARLAARGSGLVMRALRPRLAELGIAARQSIHAPARSMVYLAVCCILLAVVSMDALPADAATYQRPKGGDYRGAVDRILSADSERPVVLVVGAFPAWIVSGLQYYAWVRDSRLAIFDALRPTAADLTQLKSATSLWVAGYKDPAPPAADPPGPPRESYLDFWLLPSQGSVSSRASTVLDWVRQFEPAIGGTRQLVALTLGQLQPGPELLPVPTQSSVESGAPIPDHWTMQPSVSTSSDGKGFVLRPAGGEINAIYSTQSLSAGNSYILTVGCDPHALTGELQVFVVLQSFARTTTLPDDAGYYCSGGSPPATAFVPFSLAASSTTVTIYLRASGVGTGGFSEPSLRSLG